MVSIPHTIFPISINICWLNNGHKKIKFSAVIVCQKAKTVYLLGKHVKLWTKIFLWTCFTSLLKSGIAVVNIYLMSQWNQVIFNVANVEQLASHKYVVKTSKITKMALLLACRDAKDKVICTLHNCTYLLLFCNEWLLN